MMDSIPIIELRGTPRERGRQHGEMFRAAIREFVASVASVHLANQTQVTDERTLYAFAARNVPSLQAGAPELYEEICGVAEGSGCSLEQILFLNSMLELEDVRPPQLGARLLNAQLWGCTSFIVLPTASADGHVYVGQTFDMEEYYRRFNVVFRIVHDDDHQELIYSLVGILGLNGMNSSGIGLAINKLVATDARPGALYPQLVRQALAQRRIGDAFGALIFSDRACGMNYQLAADNGVAWCAEVSAGDYDLLPIDGAIAHTNHYLSPRMRAYEAPGWLSHGGSYVRLFVASHMLAKKRGQIDIGMLQELTCDHTNYPRCICAHGFKGDDETVAFSTIAAVIYDLTAKTMYACHGQPCSNAYSVIALDS
jgi:isopenicillin-N N-acyltransferase-like protein